MKEFVKQLKKQLIQEFKTQDRKGVYAFTQKNMAYNSNKIEGSTLTSGQTASLFDTGTIVSDEGFVYRAKDVEEMTGHFKMFNEVLKNLDKVLTANMIKAFHYQLKAGVFEDYANGYAIGEFKTRQNQVSDIVTVSPQNVPDRIEELLERYNKELSLEDIAKFHAEYESIHPFQDGNGRTGRAIILKQCLDNDIVPVIISDDDKSEYYHALHIAQTEGKYDKLCTFFEKQQQKYYDSIKDYVVILSKEVKEASELMNGFAEESLNRFLDELITLCDNSDAVRYIIRNNASMMMIDFLDGNITITHNTDAVSIRELKSVDTSSYQLFSDIVTQLKKYTDKCEDKRFEKAFHSNFLIKHQHEYDD